jgi:hypothetical protein
MSKNDFYVGWMPNAPLYFSSFVRKYLLAMTALTISLGAILALSQKKFSTGTFEFGKLTQVNGVYLNSPVPSLKIATEKDVWGNFSFITCPLIGYGKHGAGGIISDIEKETGTTLNNKEVTMKGTLLYNDGKTIFQIEKNDDPLIAIGKTAIPAFLPTIKEIGVQKIKGEIVDPKCYFGVMKPGEGKVHRDCAIRCILGGIPPVFHVQNEKGESNYYLMLGSNGKSINEKIKDIVGEPIEMEARLVRYDDWIVMYVNEKEKTQKISYHDIVNCGEKCSIVSCSAH